MDQRRPRSLAELLGHLLALEPQERVELLRELPKAELRAAHAEPEDCAATVGYDDALVLRCDRPGKVRFCGGGVCSGCCGEHACEASRAVG